MLATWYKPKKNSILFTIVHSNGIDRSSNKRRSSVVVVGVATAGEGGGAVAVHTKMTFNKCFYLEYIN